MASIHPYRTARGERRYGVRHRDGDGRRRSRAFSTLKDARAFRVEVERRRLAARGRLPSDTVEARRLFDEREVRRWLRPRHDGSTLDGNGAGR
jgi:hypothetical protein